MSHSEGTSLHTNTYLMIQIDNLFCPYPSPPPSPSSIPTAIDDNLITESPDTGQYGFFVHPNETVRLPFKYQTFSVPRHTSHEDMVHVCVCMV